MTRRVLPTEINLFLRAAVVLAVVRVALAVSSLKRTRRRLQRVSGAIRPNRPVEVPALARAIRRAARLVPDASCLAQAVTAEFLLERHVHPAELRLGVRKEAAGRFRAHAWALSDGLVVTGGVLDAEFTQLRPVGPPA